MRKLIRWCQENGFELTIDPFYYSNSVAFIFMSSEGFRYIRTITNEDLFMTQVSDDCICVSLIEQVTAAYYNHIMNPTSNWRDPLESDI